MSISKEKSQEREGIELQVGWDTFKVSLINPDRQELNEWLGTEKTDEIEYLSRDDDNNTKIRLTFWLESIKNNWKQSVSFWLTEKERTDKEGNKNQWVNQSGRTQWADDAIKLPNWFIHFMKDEKPIGDQYYRIAYDGEENFVNFLNAWLKVDRKQDTGILPDIKKIFKGNFKELTGLIGSEYVGDVVVPLGVKTKEIELKNDDGELTGETETRDYQSVFNKAFLPGKYAKYLRTGGGKEYDRKQVEYFKKAIVGEYGFKDYYIDQEAKPYNKEQNIVHSNENGKEDELPFGNDADY